jgi:hypothetical protein
MVQDNVHQVDTFPITGNQVVPYTNNDDAMRAVYLQAQIQLMDNLNRLIMSNQTGGRKSSKKVDTGRVTELQSQIDALQQEVDRLSHTNSIQDKLLKSIATLGHGPKG